MQVVTNQAFVRSRSITGKLTSFGGFACLIAGLVLSFVQQGELILLAYLTLLPGFVLINVGKYNTIRWGMKPTVDQIVANALKTLDYKYQLFNYVDDVIPQNVLLTPYCLWVLELRPMVGDFVVKGNRISRKRGATGILLTISDGSIGNPFRDAERSVDGLRTFLKARFPADVAEELPIEKVIVFTHPRTTLTEEAEPDVPVVHARDLKRAVRNTRSYTRLSPGVYQRLAGLLRQPNP